MALLWIKRKLICTQNDFDLLIWICPFAQTNFPSCPFVIHKPVVLYLYFLGHSSWAAFWSHVHSVVVVMVIAEDPSGDPPRPWTPWPARDLYAGSAEPAYTRFVRKCRSLCDFQLRDSWKPCRKRETRISFCLTFLQIWKVQVYWMRMEQLRQLDHQRRPGPIACQHQSVWMFDLELSALKWKISKRIPIFGTSMVKPAEAFSHAVREWRSRLTGGEILRSAYISPRYQGTMNSAPGRDSFTRNKRPSYGMHHATFRLSSHETRKQICTQMCANPMMLLTSCVNAPIVLHCLRGVCY